MRESGKGICPSTAQKQNSAWDKWRRFLEAANLPDCFLAGYSQLDRNGVISAFALALRRNQFGKTTKDKLRKDTVKTTASKVAQTFRTFGITDPTVDAEGQCHITLTRLYRRFDDEDTPTKRQPALPLKVFRGLYSSATSKLDNTVADLACGALFFGMRSCEYLQVAAKAGERKTKLICIKHIVFRTEGKIIKSRKISLLLQAQTVSITFETQKNGEKMETVTQFATKDRICPVKAWAHVVGRLWTIPGATRALPINTFYVNGRMFSITSEVMRAYLRRQIQRIGEDKLGFDKSMVGTHSIRASFAMLLLLNKERDSVIMKKGRWKSSAFLRYIREQIESFGNDTSAKIVGTFSEYFSIIPHFNKLKIEKY